MATEFGPSVRKAVFRWLRKAYRLKTRVAVPGAVVGRIDYAFRDKKQRLVGVVGRNLEGPDDPTGLGAFAWNTSEEANFEIAEGVLDAVILVVLADDRDEARAGRNAIAAFVATQVPPTLVNETVIGYRKKKLGRKRFAPAYHERDFF